MSEEEGQRAHGEWPSRRPGHELCAARERKGLSREEIARRLHLPQEQVDALEADEYVRLPPPAYVRGYLRAYAREVGLKPDEVVAEYDAICGEQQEPELVVHPGQPDAATGRGPVLALLVVVAVALIGAVAWWLQQPALSPIVTQEGMPTDAAEPAAVEPEPPDPGEVAGSTTAEADTAAEPTAPEAPPEPAEPATTEPAADTQDAAAADAEAEAEAEVEASGAETTAAAAQVGTDAATGTTDQDAVATAPEPATEDPAAESMIAEGDRPTATSQAELVPTEAAGTGPDRLVVDVDGESWLEVFDSRGRQLAYTLYSGDEPVELNGWAPFDVFLGNAPAVTLRYQGETVDHDAFVRSDNTARFLVDSEGARRR